MLATCCQQVKRNKTGKIPWICMYTTKIPYKIYICMFRWQDTLDMHVYSKNTSQKYTHLQVAKYLIKKKNKQEKDNTNTKRGKRNTVGELSILSIPKIMVPLTTVTRQCTTNNSVLSKNSIISFPMKKMKTKRNFINLCLRQGNYRTVLPA